MPNGVHGLAGDPGLMLPWPSRMYCLICQKILEISKSTKLYNKIQVKSVSSVQN